VRVALVSMPFQELCAPSIGLSLLQACLRREGIGCDIHYLNLHFASRIGCLGYWKLGVDSPPTSLSGEWVFAEALFGRDSKRDREYIETILEGQHRKYFDSSARRRLLRARRSVRRFLDECLERVSWANYDVVGFSSAFQQNVASLALAKRVKDAFPEKKIIFGGANCEGEMGVELHRQFPFIDFVCSGEGERAFPELLRRLKDGEDAAGIPGIISRAGGATVAPAEMVSPISDLDALPYPNYDDYFAQKKKAHLNRRFPSNVVYETSRGCWWGAKMHCTFCGLNGATMAYRSKAPERALDELLYLVRTYGKRIFCVDNILDLKYLDSLLPRIAAHGLRLNLFFETKSNLTKKQFEVLRGAGVRRMQPGIESLSSPVLKLMKKGCTMLQNVQFLKWSKQMGIKASWNILYGFPGESPANYAEMARIIPSLGHLEPPKENARFRLDRFSPYFTRSAEYGLANVRPHRAYFLVYPFSRDVLSRLAYYFEFDHPAEASVEEYARPAVAGFQTWQAAGYQGNLTGKMAGGALVLQDTRKRGRKAVNTVLREPLSSAYIFCDQVRPLSSILAHVARAAACSEPGWTSEELEVALDELVSRGLMLKEGKSYLSLAILDFPAALSEAPTDVRQEGREPEPVCTPAAPPLLQIERQPTGSSA
jgi:ribosomal peptide maturation radical SAM protein 1